MVGLSTSLLRTVILRAFVGGTLIVLAAACGNDDGTGPSTQASNPPDSAATNPPDSTTTAPTDSAGSPSDSTIPPPPIDSSGLSGAAAALDTRSSFPGIMFGSDGMRNEYFNNVHTGAKRGGGVEPDNVLPLLSDARARGARIVLKLSMGRDDYIQNSDGTFSLSKWKALVDRFKRVNLGPYIADGTILGHFIIDEPHRAAKWGGKIIPHATVEAMAKYSKQIWPAMNTFVHTKTGWLVSTSINYTYLDATWVQYAAGKGEVTKWITGEISYAKSKGLGVMMGLNVLNGGNGSSGIRGTSRGSYSMSASELRTYGTALLNQSYGCGFILWAHNLTYYGRSDMKSAMADLASKAKAHVKTSCRQ
jgi:hypothetical protein